MFFRPLLQKAFILFACLIGISSFCDGQLIRDRYATVPQPIDPFLVPIQEGKLFGFVDRSGKEVIKPQYEGVSFFSKEGYAKINKLGLFGLIDKGGKEIIPPISATEISWDGTLNAKWAGFSKIDDVYLYNIKYVLNTKSKKLLFYKTTGDRTLSDMYKYEKTPHFDKMEYDARNYEYSMGFYLGLARVMLPDGGVNFIDTTFSVILPRNLYDGSQLGNNRYVEFDESGMARLIDEKGKGLTDYVYDGIESSGLDNYFIAKKKEDSYKKTNYLIDINGKHIFSKECTKIDFVMDDLFTVKENKTGLVNLQGDTIIGLEYNRIIKYSQDLIMAEIDGTYQLFDKKGSKVSSPYTNWQQAYYCDASTGVRDGKKYLIDGKGKEIIELTETSKVNKRIHGYYITNDKYNYFLHDEKGVKIFDNPMGSILATSFDQYVVVKSKDQKSGLYDLDRRTWLHPIGERKIRYIDQRQNSAARLEIESDTEIITYHTNLKNKTTTEKQKKKNRSQKNNLHYKEKYVGEKVVLTFEDGSSIEYPKADKYSIRSYGNKDYYFEKGRSSEKQIYDRNLKQISPTGYVYKNKYEMGNEVFFEMADESRNNGLIDIKGNWIFEPKPKQHFSTYFDKFCGFNNGKGIQLLDFKFKPVTDRLFQNISYKGTQYIVAEHKDTKVIDIYNKEGKLISDSAYTGYVGAWEDFLIVSRSPNRELKSCVIDKDGNEKICLPYTSISPVDESLESFIAKDVYDFGVVDKSNNVLIDFKYKTIGYHKEISAFNLGKNEHRNDLVDLNYKPILSDLKAYFKLEELSRNGSGYSVGGEEGYAYFDENGKFIKKFDADLGRPSCSKYLNAAGLIRFNKGDQTIFADAKSGFVYKRL